MAVRDGSGFALSASAGGNLEVIAAAPSYFLVVGQGGTMARVTRQALTPIPAATTQSICCCA